MDSWQNNNMNDAVPRLKDSRYKKSVTIWLPEEFHGAWMEMKLKHRVDCSEWARQVLEKEFQKLKKQIEAA